MGSSSSKKTSPIRQQFPSDSSIKSCSSYGGFDENEEDLQGKILRQARKIKELEDFNGKLQNEVTELRKNVEQLTFQLSVAGGQLPNLNVPSGRSAVVKVDTGDGEERTLPRVGDHVVSMWGSSKWQYFTATIQSFDKSTLKYTIEWDDHDPTGRVVDYYNLALDHVPPEDQIGVGSVVLFNQGKYRQQEVHGITRSGGMRWHQGEIDKIYTDSDGTKRYEGHHTKGENDGKWVTYKDYKETFTGYSLDDLRMPPNVFDILSSIEEPQAAGDETDYHVFVSYAKVNCPSAIQGSEIPRNMLPPSYEESMLQTMCDPRNIVERLRSMGLRVFTMENDADDSLLKVATALKSVKVFIACLSDEYAGNDRCRMEFQHAKKTMKLPIIPLVVGTGSFQWQMTVVGLLIVGELYIHFKSKEVEEFKMTELARRIKTILPDVEIKDVRHPAIADGQVEMLNDPNKTVTGNPLVSGRADFFFSYCWNNSHEAEQRGQISNCVGGEFSDPRLVCNKLSVALKQSPWIDVQRLGSTTDGMGMFGQIAEALKECKVVVACVSNEYANSDNCSMEFRFAAESLRKPLVVVVVGTGDEWLKTTIGNLVDERYPTISLQDVSNTKELETKITEISTAVQKQVGIEIQEPSGEAPSGEAPSDVVKFNAPVPGDHVVCLHQKWAYFMSTIVSFDEKSMMYTVDWDDGDPTGRCQSYKDVALDKTPVESDIGEGTIVLFGQGQYGGTQGNNSGGVRYHQGKITRVYKDLNGVTRYDGVHTKDGDDSKWITYKGYESSFHGKSLSELRLSPTAMDALMACKQAFVLSN